MSVTPFDEARRLRRLAAETGDLRFHRAAEQLDAPRPESSDVVGEEVRYLKSICADGGIAVSILGTVCEADAAKLAERSKKTLERWRFEGKGIPVTWSGKRARYALRDIAIWRIRGK